MLIDSTTRDNRKVNNFFQMRSPEPLTATKQASMNPKKLIKLHSTFYSGTKVNSPPPPSKAIDNKVALQFN